MPKTSHDSESPAHGQQVITACAFIHHNFDGTEKLFWPKRATTKKFLPNVYELPGGHIDFGEDISEGVKREILEEFGMKVSIGDAFAAFAYTNEIKGSHSAEIVYFAEFTDPIENVKLDPADHSTFGWFAENEIEQQFIESRPDGEDPEAAIIRKGFALLRGEHPSFK